MESRWGHLGHITDKGGTTLGFPPWSERCLLETPGAKIQADHQCMFLPVCFLLVMCCGRPLEIAWVTTMGTQLDKTAQKHCCPFKLLYTFQQDRCNANETAHKSNYRTHFIDLC